MHGVPPVFIVVEALMCQSGYPKRIAITALALALVAGVQLTAAAEEDLHRPMPELYDVTGWVFTG
jgi:hypothetical protein